jgi:hypothetical protein
MCVNIEAKSANARYMPKHLVRKHSQSEHRPITVVGSCLSSNNQTAGSLLHFTSLLPTSFSSYL